MSIIADDMLKVTFKGIKQFQKDVNRFPKAAAHASRNTLNQGVAFAQRESKKLVSKQMIQRNKFTIQSIRFDKTKSLNIREQVAVVGSTADYMERQEFGGVKRRKGKHGVPIPTSYSAGQAEDSKPRRRLPRRANQLRNIKLRRNLIKAANRGQRNAIVVRSALGSQRYVYLKFRQVKGIFKVLGRKSNPKAARVKMVHDVSRVTVKIKSRPWLKPSIDKTIEQMPTIHLKSLQFQLDRLKMFKNKR